MPLAERVFAGALYRKQFWMAPVGESPFSAATSIASPDPAKSNVALWQSSVMYGAGGIRMVVANV